MMRPLGTFRGRSRPALVREVVSAWPDLRTNPGDVVQALLWRDEDGWVATVTVFGRELIEAAREMVAREEVEG